MLGVRFCAVQPNSSPQRLQKKESQRLINY
jgi:hypothetical protein